MKSLGYWLVGLGALAGSWTAVIGETAVNWAWFSAALAPAVVGIVLIRRGERAVALDSGRLERDWSILSESLGRITRNAAELAERREEIDVYEAHEEVDRYFPSDLAAFVAARKTIIHRHGLDAYADVMNEFCAGERYLNRVWSASVDGYVDEVQAYLLRASEQFAEARTKLAALDA